MMRWEQNENGETLNTIYVFLLLSVSFPSLEITGESQPTRK